MGQILSHPKTGKTTEAAADGRHAYALSCMQGWRVSMEDSHSTVLNLNVVTDGEAAETETAANGASEAADASAGSPVAFFGVYDGHGGEKVALFTGEKLPSVLKATEAYQKGDYAQALQDAFLAMDVEITEDAELSKDPSGCAATSVIITSDKIFCGNAGDSRTVMSVGGTVKALSFDHKPTNEGEKARIVNAGGFVDMGRVNGNLALSRGIGDFEFKNNLELPAEEQAVTALPDVLEHDITKDDEFVVLACDGIWDCLSSQQVVDFVRRYVREGKPLGEICELMMTTCLAPTSGGSGIGCDNMSVCIVAMLQGGESVEEWAKRIAAKVSDEDLEKLPTADALSMELYSMDIATKVQETSEEDEEMEEAPGEEKNANAFLKQLLASATASQDGNVIYLDPSTSHILQSLGVVEGGADGETAEGEGEGEGEGKSADDAAEHKIQLAEEES